MEKNNSTYERTQQNQLNKNKNGVSKISAIEKADNGDYENAIVEFTRLILINPNDTGSYFARATIRVSIGDIEGSLQDFKMCEISDLKNNSNFENYPLV